MLLHFLAALYICNGIAAGSLGFDETLPHPWRVALQLNNRRDVIVTTGCPTDWVQCPDGNGCCETASQCGYSKGSPVCNIPCDSESTPCNGGCCPQAVYTCSGSLCVAGYTLNGVLLTTLANTGVEANTVIISTAETSVVKTASAATSAAETSEISTTTSSAYTLPTFTSGTPTTPITSTASATPSVPGSSSSTSRVPLKTSTGSIALITMSSVISFAVIAVCGIFHFS